MTSNLEPEERQALDALFGASSNEQPPVSDVEQRDFSRPRRFAAAELERLGKVFREAFEPLGAELTQRLHGASVSMSLTGMRETSAEEVTRAADGAALVLRFDAGKEPAWVAWSRRAAQEAVERLVGSAPASAESATRSAPASAARELSRVEQRLVQGLFESVAKAALAARSLPLTQSRLARTPEELGSWSEAGAAADPWRLRLDVSFECPSACSSASSFYVFLPVGALPADLAERASAKVASGSKAAPAHIAEVALEVRAYLGANEVPFQDLVRLEVGDVIPLGVTLGAPLSVVVEGRACAHAALGTHDGHLALKILDLKAEATDQD